MASDEGFEVLEGLPGFGDKRAVCRALLRSYPAVQVVALGGPQDQSPRRYKETYPDSDFARVALPQARRVVWFFRDELAREHYRNWCLGPGADALSRAIAEVSGPRAPSR